MPKHQLHRPPKRVIVVTPFAPAMGTHGGAAQIFNVWSAFKKSYPKITVKMLCGCVPEEYSPSTLAYARQLGARTFAPEKVEHTISAMPALFPKSWAPYANSALREALKRATKAWPDAVVVLEMTLALHYLDSLAKHTKVVLVTHEALARRFMQDWRLAASKGDSSAQEKEDFFHEVFRYESHYMGRVTRALCLSSEDAEYVRVALNACHVDTMPLCIPVKSIRDRVSKVRPEPDTVCFWGSFIHPPNVDGVEYMLKDVWPIVRKARPRAKFRIYGSYLPENLRLKWRAQLGVDVNGYAKDLYRAVARNSVAVVPVVTGHGVRTKFLEALAMKRPVVTTRLGAEGLPVEHKVSCMIADNGVDFSRHLIKLLKDDRLRLSIGRAGYRVAQQHAAKRSAAVLFNALRHLNASPN